MSTISTSHATVRNLPIIPLRGNVAFPHTHYRIDSISGSAAYAFAEALSAGEDVLLLAQKDIALDQLETDSFFLVGTIAHTQKLIQNPDNSRTIIFECVSRAAVLNVTAVEEAFYAIATEIGETNINPEQHTGARACVRTLREILQAMESYSKEPAHTAYLAASSIGELGAMVDFIASNVLSDYMAKQLILDEIDPLARITSLNTILNAELTRLECDASIQATVHENMAEHQREYYLREQLKAIQSELGSEDEELNDYAERIEAANLPLTVAEKLQKELSRLAKAPYGSPESTVLRNYLDTCLDIPWGKLSEEAISVTGAAELLDREHDGLQKVKERILEYIAVSQITGAVGSQILCLVGPPGVGKTSIAHSIARALHRPSARISLGGIRDEADIRGHRKTYVGAMPGRFVEALTRAGVMNPVIILDEIDKLGVSQMGDPSSALLEVLDPEQNATFRDHFTELPMDLSQCVFIATANHYDGIPAPLLDRMEIIEVSSYTDTEKYAIATNHLLPKQLKKHGLTSAQLRFTEAGMYTAIRQYTKEAGVRNLEREIASICRKVAKKIAEGSAKSAIITPATIKHYLGAPRFVDEKPVQENPVGVVNGLAYTTTGGDLLKVEVLVIPGKGEVILTGSLGEVMKESAQIAISYVRSIASKLDIDPDFHAKYDLHIHFPEGAIPKDGPSAGVTMTCAIVSALTGIPARADVAMTGEITLRGRVLPIGGLKEKTMAAYRGGMSTVLVPRQNGPDLEQIDPEARKHLHFVFCDTVEDALKNVLLLPKSFISTLTDTASATHSKQAEKSTPKKKRKV